MSAPLVKFRTYRHRSTIDTIECTRETEMSVFYMHTVRMSKGDRIEERRKVKRSEFEQIHDSWSDAMQYLLRRAEAKVTQARRSLELANAELGNIKGMKPPAA